MKHLIVFNPGAGEGKNDGTSFEEKINASFKGLDYEVYKTEGPRKAIPFLREYLKKNIKEKVRVYACGGDGTIHEVVNGLVGFENAELAILPIGTGNDFVKIYGVNNDNVDQYRSFKPLIEGKPIDIDLSVIRGGYLEEPWYSVNVINFGFDAIVGAKGNENKLKGKKNPYGPAAIVPAILGGRFNNIIVKADGVQLNEKKCLNGSLSQGQFVGGKFRASPKSDNTDGLIDVVMIKCISLLTLLTKMLGAYEKGAHVENPKFAKKVIYKQAKEIEIIAPKDIDVCVDGEMIRGKEFKVEICPKALKLVPPAKEE